MPDIYKSQHFTTAEELDDALYAATLVPGLRAEVEQAKEDAVNAATVVSTEQPEAGLWLEVIP
jgi:hypothetical protein